MTVTLSPLPTQAPAAGGVLEASWNATSLSKLFPKAFELLGELIDGLHLKEAFEALQIALKVAATAQQASALLVALPDALMAALDIVLGKLIDEIAAQIDNFRNTGQSVLILPPTPGGMRGATRVIRAALLNVRDNQRPNFQPGATVAGWAIIAVADVGTTKKIVDAITLLFTSSDKLAAQSAAKTTISLNFPDPFAAQKIAGRPAPQNTPKWLRARVIDMIPGGDEAFDQLIAGLKSMRPPPFNPLGPLSDYLKMIDRYIQRILAILIVITAIVTLLRTLFIDVPVKILEFDAQFGSTQDIADSLSPWFATSQPILSDVPDDLYTCGVFAVIGGEDPLSPGVQMDALRLLFLP